MRSGRAGLPWGAATSMLHWPWPCRLGHRASITGPTAEGPPEPPSGENYSRTKHPASPQRGPRELDWAEGAGPSSVTQCEEFMSGFQ